MPKQKFDGPFIWPELKTPTLTVQAIRVASVSAIAQTVLLNSYNPSDILRLVQDWRKLYGANVNPVEEDAFWRAVFMDTNVQVHWLARRTKSLIQPRLKDIRAWFRSWSKTSDYRDLSNDRKSGGVTRGAFHYRAVQRNAEKTRFFVTSQSLPGMGPFDMRIEDEIYAVKGCKALVVLREVQSAEKEVSQGFEVVGLCFVDRWMYGRAIQGRPRWETLQLI